MTPDDEKLAKAAFHRGPLAMTEAGMDPQAQAAFLSRDDVRQFMQTFEKTVEIEPALMVRTRAIARQQLSRWTDNAVQVLGDVLAGPEYVRGKDGAIVYEKFEDKGKTKFRPKRLKEMPLDVQIAVAQDVLDRLGVNDSKKQEQVSGVNINMFGTPQQSEALLALTSGMNDEQAVVVREQLRTAMEALAGTLPKAREEVAARISNDVVQKRRQRRDKKLKTAKH